MKGKRLQHKKHKKVDRKPVVLMANLINWSLSTSHFHPFVGYSATSLCHTTTMFKEGELKVYEYIARLLTYQEQYNYMTKTDHKSCRILKAQTKLHIHKW